MHQQVHGWRNLHLSALPTAIIINRDICPLFHYLKLLAEPKKFATA